MAGIRKKKHPVDHFYRGHLILKAGAWRKWFTEEQYKWMMAVSLNECQTPEDPCMPLLLIKGYLIKEDKIYLVCKTENEDLHRILDFFYWTVKQTVLHELNRLYRLHESGIWHERHKTMEKHGYHLFEKRPFTNEWLVSLITGHPVSLKYYDPLLERMKKMVKEENYCSAIDYAGGISPVNMFAMIKLMPPVKTAEEKK